MTFESPSHPDLRDRIEAVFLQQGLMGFLGVQLGEVVSGRVRLLLPYRQELTQQHGYFHAGATSSIADSAGGFAGLTVFPAGSSVLSVEFKINLLAPAKGDRLEAVGSVIRSGRTLTVCQFEVFAIADEVRTVVAVGQQTLICIPERSAAAN